MENIIIGSLLAFAISFYGMPIIILVANQKHLYDLPGVRKIHSQPIPSLGGLGIFIGFVMGLLLTLEINSIANELQYFLAAFLVVFFFGVKDDVLNLVPMKKLLGQLIVAALLIFKGNLLITDMYGFAGIYHLHTSFSYLFTVATIVVVMNSFNLIDGVDGLAGSLGVITSVVFGLFFYFKGDSFYALMGFLLAASTIAFLIYNYSPAKIFMGDTGSMLIGVVNAILVIRFIQTFNNTPLIPVLSAPAMGFGILAVPLLDTLRVFAIRILKGKSPFSPDRNHLHHLLLDKGFTHSQITLTLSSLAIIYILATYFTLHLGATRIILCQILIFFSGIYFLTRKKIKPVELHIVREDKPFEIAETNVIISKKGRNFFSTITSTSLEETQN